MVCRGAMKSILRVIGLRPNGLEGRGLRKVVFEEFPQQAAFDLWVAVPIIVDAETKRAGAPDALKVLFDARQWRLEQDE